MSDSSFPSANLRQQALETGHQILERMIDRSSVLGVAAASPFAQVVYPDEPPLRWTGANLDYGDCGLALAFGYLDKIEPDRGWDGVAHRYICEAVERLAHRDSIPSGLFHEDSSIGVAYVTRLLSRRGTRYGEAVSALDGDVIQSAQQSLKRLPAHGPIHWSMFDHIAGLTGVGRYLLLAAGDNPSAEQALHNTLHHLIQRSLQPIPDFKTPVNMSGALFTVDNSATSTDLSYISLGLAHGISGPLALMSLALAEGFDLPGLVEATEHLATWLCEQIEEGEYGADIPYSVTTQLRKLPADGVTRSAWCHGNPGVSSTLRMAARALHDERFFQASERLMDSALARPRNIQGIISPTLCHGLAGLVYLSWKRDVVNGHSDLRGVTSEMLRELLDQKNEANPLFFHENHPEIGQYTNPGLLGGSLGIALTLLTLGSGVEPTWDQLLLLS